MAAGRTDSFLGGSALTVVIKLLLLSLLVGFLLSYFEVTPWNLFEWAQSTVSRLFRQGWRTLGEVGSWVVLGAIIVVPVWLLSRLFARRR